MIFICLENQEIAQHRVNVRTKFGGHFVNNETIDFKWKAGYKNFNLHYEFFDSVLIVDNSRSGKLITNLVQINSGIIEVMVDQLPDYFERRFPHLFAKLNQ